MWAAADAAQYECELSPIAFRPTLMFQTRSFAFTLRNGGLTRMPFSWAVVAGDVQDTSGLFQARCHRPFSQRLGCHCRMCHTLAPRERRVMRLNDMVNHRLAQHAWYPV